MALTINLFIFTTKQKTKKMETLIVATIQKKGDWWNLTDNKEREISCFTGHDKETGKPSNPISNKILQGAGSGSEVAVNVRSGKNGKNYIFDPKPASGGGTGKSYAPKDKPLEAAHTAIQAAASMHALTKDATPEKVIETAEKFHSWILSKKTI